MSKAHLRCDNCGTEFWHKYKTKRFCCKQCAKDFRIKNNPFVKGLPESQRRCSKCNQVKDKSNFRLNSKTHWCLECFSKQGKDYYNSHIEQFKETRAQYYINNKEQVNARNNDYYERNRNETLARQKKYQEQNEDLVREIKRKSWNKAYHNDSIFKLRKRISDGIRIAFKRQGHSKGGISVFDHLNYSIEELKAHIEAKFEPWMTWQNHGNYSVKTWDDNDTSTWTWQLDHIIPQASLPFSSMEDENFKKCWALENLRPYSAKQNLLDGTVRNRSRICPT